MSIYFDSNGGMVVWAASVSKLVTNAVHATANSTTTPLVFECTVAGTTGGTQPTWPTIIGNTVVDGTVTWTARSPDSWALALPTMQRALDSWRTLNDGTVSLIGEKLHFESNSTSIILNPPSYDHLISANVYRYDKGTDKYSPASEDNSTNVNFESTNSDISITGEINLFGFRFASAKDFTVSRSHLEDCDVEYGILQASNIVFNLTAYITWVNCRFTANKFPGCSILMSARVYGSVSMCSFDIDNPVTGLFQDLIKVIPYSAIDFYACDFSKLTNPTVMNSADFANGVALNAASHTLKYTFDSCLFPDNFAMWNGTDWIATAATYVEVTNCSADGMLLTLNYRKDLGGERRSDTVNYALDGYFDARSSVNLSEKLMPGINCRPSTNIQSSRIGSFIVVAGSTTFTIELIDNFSSPLTMKELWFDLYYYESGGARYTIDTSTKEYAQLTYTDLPAGMGLAGWAGDTTGYRSSKIQATVNVARPGLASVIVRLGRYEAGKVAIIDTVLRVT